MANNYNRNYNKNYSNSDGGSSIGGIIALIVVIALLVVFIGWASSWYTDWSFSTLTETVNSIFPGSDDQTVDGDTTDGDSSGSGSTDNDQSGGTTDDEGAYSITYVLSGVTSSSANPDAMEDGETLTLYFYKTDAALTLNSVTVTGAALVYYEDQSETSSGDAIIVIINEATASVTVNVTAE